MQNFPSDIPGPDYLLVADQPLALGGVPRRVALSEIQEMFGFNYCETIQIPTGFSFVLEPGDEAFNSHDYPKLEERLLHPLNEALVVCYIDSTVGYGLFARNPIAANTVIGLYSGIIEEAQEAPLAYELGVQQGAVINAEVSGGITRFIQHMPWSRQALSRALSLQAAKGAADLLETLDTFGCFPFSEAEQARLRGKSVQELQGYADQLARVIIEDVTKKSASVLEDETFDVLQGNIATANVISTSLVKNSQKIVYFKTVRDIEEGEQLGFNYGQLYWEAFGRAPMRFSTQGNLIPLYKSRPQLKALLQRYQLSSDEDLPGEEEVLRRCAEKNHCEGIKLLLSLGVSVNAQSSETGKTALHCAIEHNQDSAIKLLLEKGAGTNLPDNSGRLPFGKDSDGNPPFEGKKNLRHKYKKYINTASTNSAAAASGSGVMAEQSIAELKVTADTTYQQGKLAFREQKGEEAAAFFTSAKTQYMGLLQNSCFADDQKIQRRVDKMSNEEQYDPAIVSQLSS